MERARPTIEPDASPIEDPVGGVRVLLDLEDEASCVDRVEAPRRSEKRVSALDAEAAHQRLDGVEPLVDVTFPWRRC